MTILQSQSLQPQPISESDSKECKNNNNNTLKRSRSLDDYHVKRINAKFQKTDTAIDEVNVVDNLTKETATIKNDLNISMALPNNSINNKFNHSNKVELPLNDQKFRRNSTNINYTNNTVSTLKSKQSIFVHDFILKKN